MNEYLSKIYSLLDTHGIFHQIMDYTRFKLLERKITFTQNMWSVKTKFWKNFITTIIKTI